MTENWAQTQSGIVKCVRRASGGNIGVFFTKSFTGGALGGFICELISIIAKIIHQSRLH